MISDKSEIIAQYNLLKKHLGHQPSSTEFYNETKISQRRLENYYGSNAFTKLVEECGDKPKAFGKEKSDFEIILIQYGDLFRELEKHPVEAEWKVRKYSPSVSGITVSHKIKWSDMPALFLEYAILDKERWQDVINLIPANNSIIQKESNNYNGRLSFQLQNYIPPIVQDLIELSYNDNGSAFEKKINTVFEMLGFEVKHLGQGTGRKPDGIALSKANPRYSILIDSKSRSEGYKFSTDDRAFVEYIKTYVQRLQNDGYDKLYFLVVSSKFVSIPEASIKRLALETHIPITFLSSRLLLNILANKIEKPRLFDLNKFRELLIESGEISEKNIAKFFININKNNTI